MSKKYQCPYCPKELIYGRLRTHIVNDHKSKIMPEEQKTDKDYVFVLLTESYEFGEFTVKGVFSDIEKVNKYVDKELSSTTKYEVIRGRYNP